jgi:cell division protein FtsN
MAFTEAQLQAQLASDGLNSRITQFLNAGTSTDVFVQNMNTATSKKSGWTQVAQSNTAAQAAALIRTNMTAR